MPEPQDSFAILNDKPAVAGDRPADRAAVERVKARALERDYAKPPPPPTQKIHVFLKSHDDAGGDPDTTNTVNVTPSKVYVIIGNGFAAVSNHATLLKSDGERSQQLKECDRVYHLGFPDPWTAYVVHNMNQEPELNIPPGYGEEPWTAERCGRGPQPGTDADPRWLPSDKFAGFTAAEFGLIKRWWGEKFELKQNAVLEIGRKQEDYPHPPFHRITLDGRETIDAHYIDVCTGVGQQRILNPGTGRYDLQMPFGLWWDYLNPRKAEDAARTGVQKVFSAEMYVRNSVLPVTGGRVLVTGGNSPAAIQAMEHALGEDANGANRAHAAAQVVLLASRNVNAGFPGIGRLDYHVTDMEDRPLPKRHTAPDVPLKPTSTQVLFCEGFVLDAIEETADRRQVVVTFKSDKNARFAAKTSQLSVASGETFYAVFDQVVLSTGRERFNDKGTDDRPRDPSLGSTGRIIQPAGGFRPLKNGISDTADEIALGLESDDPKLIRVLGAAGLNHHLVATPRDPPQPLAVYESSLPCQARVIGEGVGLAAATIGYANEFHRKPLPDHGEPPKKLNRNVNFATLAELKSLLDAELAKSIYYARAWRIAPFSTARQLANVVAIYETWFTSDYARSRPQPGDWSSAEVINRRTAMINDDTQLLRENPVFPYGSAQAMLADDHRRAAAVKAQVEEAELGFFYPVRAYPERLG